MTIKNIIDIGNFIQKWGDHDNAFLLSRIMEDVKLEDMQSNL